MDERLRCALDFAFCHGLVLRKPLEESETDAELTTLTTHLPFALYPTSFPREAFQKAVSIQPLFNTLYQRVANDYDFLKESLKSYAK